MSLHPLVHLFVLVAAAVGAWVALGRRYRVEPAAAWPLLALVPLLGAPLLGTDGGWLLGTEGAVEAVTEGVLLALAVRAWRWESPVLAAAAALLFLEEVDYGQVLVGFQTPEALVPEGSRSDRLNFHNTWMSGLWRIVPMLGLLALALAPERWEWIERLRLPRFGRSALAGLLIAGVGAALARAWLGPRPADELAELIAVVTVASSWRPKRPTPVAPTPDGSRPRS